MQNTPHSSTTACQFVWQIVQMSLKITQFQERTNCRRSGRLQICLIEAHHWARIALLFNLAQSEKSCVCVAAIFIAIWNFTMGSYSVNSCAHLSVNTLHLRIIKRKINEAAASGRLGAIHVNAIKINKARVDHFRTSTGTTNWKVIFNSNCLLIKSPNRHSKFRTESIWFGCSSSKLACLLTYRADSVLFFFCTMPIYIFFMLFFHRRFNMNKWATKKRYFSSWRTRHEFPHVPCNQIQFLTNGEKKKNSF